MSILGMTASRVDMVQLSDKAKGACSTKLLTKLNFDSDNIESINNFDQDDSFELSKIATSREYLRLRDTILIWMASFGLTISSPNEPKWCSNCECRIRFTKSPILHELGSMEKRIEGVVRRGRNQKNREEEQPHNARNENSNCSCYQINSIDSYETKHVTRTSFSAGLVSQFVPVKYKDTLLSKKRLFLLIDISWFTLITYLSCKQMLIALVTFQSQISLEKLNSSVRLGATRTENCALGQDVFFNQTSEDYENYQNYLYFYQFKDSIGILLHVVPSLITLFYAAVSGFGLTIIVLISLVNICEKCEIHHLNFVLDPLFEKRRLKKELWNMIGPLIESANIHSKVSKKMELLRNKEFKAKQLAGASKLFDKAKSQKISTSMGKDQYHHIIKDTRGDDKLAPNFFKEVWFCKNLLQIVELDLVQPKPVSANRMMRIQKEHPSLFIFGIVGWLSIVFICGSVIAYKEIAYRIDDRLLHLECQRFSPNAIPIRKIAFLPTIDVHEQKAYADHDGSYLGRYKLAYIEVKYLLKPRFVMTLLESGFVAVVVVHWFIFFFDLNIHIFRDKLIWINQVLDLVEMFPTIMHRKEKLEAKQFKLDCEIEAMKMLENDANKKLIIGYLNFELFRLQHRAYKEISNFLLAGAILVWLTALVLCYYLKIRIKKYDTAAFIMVAYMWVVAITVFQICGSIIVKKIELLMRKIFSVLACAAKNNSTQFSYPVELWRRQALDERDSERIFSLSIAGSYVSYKQILTLNVYLFCFALILINKEGFNFAIIV